MAGLLLDENLSESVVPAIVDVFPGSVHLRTLGLGGVADREVWETAKRRDLILLTRDSDFETLSLMFGHPPKVVHLRAFNPSNRDVVRALRRQAKVIEQFWQDPKLSFLSLSIPRASDEGVD